MKKSNNINKITDISNNKFIGKDRLYDIMLNALIDKYGLILTSAQVAEVLAISTRTLDERRKSNMDCPQYVEGRGKNIYYPVQKVVEYQLTKSENCVKILLCS
ncbi:hypothetical protein [Aliarcobacter butzleri]|uniref:hypothetical protein n=1 Tax=Aliarcobacter butzleri TaxID=28197 RepID=UPI0021B427CF|nr:hypothetical protein [Aliarcobacter butzleri]MCT7536304.1 hypothetical protein [Aliarcobacter butzleri]MCT7579062.1 hypothetical protein [Aliarcobacter butzleri]MCT7623003.1 hypothetical protein [Aliarcobacter butzleri]